MAEPVLEKLQTLTTNGEKFIRFLFSLGGLIVIVTSWYYTEIAGKKQDVKTQVAIAEAAMRSNAEISQIRAALKTVQRNQNIILRVQKEASPKVYARILKDEAQLERQKNPRVNWEAACNGEPICDGL